MADCTLEAWLGSHEDATPDIVVTIDTDSWLAEETGPDPLYAALWDRFSHAHEEADRDVRHGHLMDVFPNFVYNLLDEESEDESFVIAAWALEEDPLVPQRPTGFYGEGDPVSVFTPNGETMLSRDLQFVLWEDHHGSHVLLRSADSYNGYGNAEVFAALGDDGTELLDYARAMVVCDTCEAGWDHEPGHNGTDSGSGFGRLPGYREKGDYGFAEGTHGVEGTLVIDNDERAAFCPVCGKGKLIGVKY